MRGFNLQDELELRHAAVGELPAQRLHVRGALHERVTHQVRVLHHEIEVRQVFRSERGEGEEGIG